MNDGLTMQQRTHMLLEKLMLHYSANAAPIQEISLRQVLGQTNPADFFPSDVATACMLLGIPSSVLLASPEAQRQIRETFCAGLITIYPCRNPMNKADPGVYYYPITARYEAWSNELRLEQLASDVAIDLLTKVIDAGRGQRPILSRLAHEVINGQ